LGRIPTIGVMLWAQIIILTMSHPKLQYR
jgi:hypothetical protein